jgi:exopolysaccharide biosynthesis polyprenyl glycosylphosphotransferase
MDSVTQAPALVAPRNFLREHYRTLIVLWLLLVDVISIVAGFYLAFQLRRLIPLPEPAQGVTRFLDFLPLLVVQIATIVLAFFFARMYHRNRTRYGTDELQAIFSGVSIGTLASVAVSAFMFKSGFDYPRVMVVYAWLVTIVLVLLMRTVQARLQRGLQAQGYGRTRVLIIGAGEPATNVVQRIRQNPRLGYDIVGFVSAKDETWNDVRPSAIKVTTSSFIPRVLGTTDDVTAILEDEVIDEVIIAMPEASDEELVSLIARCDRSTISIKVLPDIFQLMAGQMSIGELGGLPLLNVRDVALRGWRMVLKRVMDIVISAFALVVLSPLLVFIAILIKRDSHGPAIFSQPRMGLDGKLFHVIKFRTMRFDAELLGTWTVKDDPRKTRLGALLRRTNLDELPQFINVLLGEMSVVGPRPEQPRYVEEFRKNIPRYMERHREKAGITGWAQVNGLRGDTSIEERTQYDLWYVENWSVWLDIKIILRQLWQWLAGRDENAY